MTVTWVLESNVFAEKCFDEMIEHFTKRKMPYHVVRIIPFVHEVDGKTPKADVCRYCGGSGMEDPLDDDHSPACKGCHGNGLSKVVCYGSIGIQKLANRECWVPGVFTDEATFNYEAYQFALGDLLVNHDCKVMMLSEADSYMAEIGYDKAFFIKPNGDTKQFAGTVMDGYEFLPWHKKMLNIGYLEEEDFEVVVAPPKKLGCEWRAVVVDGKISDCSIYRQYGIVKPERHIIPEVEAAIMEAQRRFTPAPVYVIDIAQVSNGDGGWDYKVVEYNTFNSAGLYACDVGKIIDDVTDYVENAQ